MTDLARLKMTMTERRQEEGFGRRVLDTEVLVLKSEVVDDLRLMSVDRLAYVLPLPSYEEIGNAVAADIFAQVDLPRLFREFGDKVGGLSDPLGLVAFPHLHETAVPDNHSLIRWVTRQGFVKARVE